MSNFARETIMMQGFIYWLSVWFLQAGKENSQNQV
jgi:hypothetical protein